MDQHPDPDSRPVYHAVNGHPRPPAVLEMPRRFALCGYDEDDPDETIDLSNVVGWGLEFDNEAVVFLRSPDSGCHSQAICESADSARDLFGIVEPLCLVRM